VTKFHLSGDAGGLASAAGRPRVNYVVATWSGPRRYNPPTATFYLEHQLRHLAETPHDLTQVTLVVPDNIEEPEEFTRWLEKCPRRLASARLEILRRPNQGMSYGSFSHAFSVYRQTFDYYVFVEDDYVFEQPYSDRLLREMFEQDPQCGYLAGVVLGEGDRRHGAVSIGITSCQVLEAIWRQHGEIPHARHLGAYESAHQIEFTRAFLAKGRSLRDVTSRYRVIYNDLGRPWTFGPAEAPILIRPIYHDAV
jgi:hypothetical protein